MTATEPFTTPEHPRQRYLERYAGVAGRAGAEGVRAPRLTDLDLARTADAPAPAEHGR